MEQLANAITFYVHFIESKVSKTGLTVTCDVWELTQAGGATEIVTAGSASEIGDGLYKYVLASGSVDAVGEYIAVFKPQTPRWISNTSRRCGLSGAAATRIWTPQSAAATPQRHRPQTQTQRLYAVS